MSALIKKLREQIDQLDDEILQLLSQRNQLALQIGQIKKQNHQEIRDIRREEEILKRLSLQKKLTYDEIVLVYGAIFTLTKQIQEYGENKPSI